jgi:hypothetical protein
MEGWTRTARRVARALALACALALATAMTSPVTASQQAARTYAWVTIHEAAPGRPVPSTFLGLSFELSSLGEVARLGERGNLVTLLRSLGSGVLRFGGVSADTQVAWTDAQTPRPAWASQVIGVEDLKRLARLASASGWRVLLTIGLAHFEPQAAAREAEAARTILGPWLAGIEVGNEPNAYANHDLRGQPWTFSQYASQASRYIEAIAAQGGSRLPLAGPDVSGSPAFLSWGAGEAVGLSPALLTGHHYPLGCHDAPPPTVARLLSPTIRRNERMSTRRYMTAAAHAGIPFRLDETGSVSCGGRAGVSDTFGATLWAVDYIAHTMAAGMAGINFHGNLANCRGYSPLCAASPAARQAGSLQAQPEWYALLLDRSLVGDEPLQSVVGWRHHANIDVVSTRAPDGTLHVLLVDDEPPGSRAVVTTVDTRRQLASASTLELRAPSLLATRGVTLGGVSVSANGTWSRPQTAKSVTTRGGTVTVVLSPSSAQLLTLSAAPRAQPTHTPARHGRGLAWRLARRG